MEGLIDISKVTHDSSGIDSDDQHYPYGTSLFFNGNLVEELGIQLLSPGDIVEVFGHAVVENVNENSDKKGSEKNISIQLTAVKVKRSPIDRVKQMYSES